MRKAFYHFALFYVFSRTQPNTRTLYTTIYKPENPTNYPAKFIIRFWSLFILYNSGFLLRNFTFSTTRILCKHPLTASNLDAHVWTNRIINDVKQKFVFPGDFWPPLFTNKNKSSSFAVYRCDGSRGPCFIYVSKILLLLRMRCRYSVIKYSLKQYYNVNNNNEFELSTTKDG